MRDQVNDFLTGQNDYSTMINNCTEQFGKTNKFGSNFDESMAKDWFSQFGITEDSYKGIQQDLDNDKKLSEELKKVNEGKNENEKKDGIDLEKHPELKDSINEVGKVLNGVGEKG